MEVFTMEEILSTSLEARLRTLGHMPHVLSDSEMFHEFKLALSPVINLLAEASERGVASSLHLSSVNSSRLASVIKRRFSNENDLSEYWGRYTDALRLEITIGSKPLRDKKSRILTPLAIEIRRIQDFGHPEQGWFLARYIAALKVNEMDADIEEARAYGTHNYQKTDVPKHMFVCHSADLQSLNKTIDSLLQDITLFIRSTLLSGDVQSTLVHTIDDKDDNKCLKSTYKSAHIQVMPPSLSSQPLTKSSKSLPKMLANVIERHPVKSSIVTGGAFLIDNTHLSLSLLGGWLFAMCLPSLVKLLAYRK
jgi:hypothetical protein